MSEAGFRSGRVAVMGRTNAGKSTLVNRLVGEKVAIVSPVPQTTRSVILGVLNEPDAQLVFLDTPGIHAPQYLLNRRMLEDAQGAMAGADVTLLVVDAADRPGRGDAFALQRVRDAGLPFVVALNKVDALSRKEDLLPMIERHAEAGARAVVPTSALEGTGLDGLLAELRALLPEAPPLQRRDVVSDQSRAFRVGELIREKVFLATREEVPHASTVFVESMAERAREDGRRILVVEATIAVEKENQKAIMIGRGGAMLKRIGTAARLEIESALGVSCHLSLHVVVLPRWRDDQGVLERVFSDARASATADVIAADDDATEEPVDEGDGR